MAGKVGKVPLTVKQECRIPDAALVRAETARKSKIQRPIAARLKQDKKWNIGKFLHRMCRHKSFPFVAAQTLKT